MRIPPKPLFAFSLLVFGVAAACISWQQIPRSTSGLVDCSARVIMRFENMEQENVNGSVHFNFGPKGKGSMVVEGYTDSDAGSLYLQRYVTFTYTVRRISAVENHYSVSRWQASTSSIDRSPDIIFDYFMREMSFSHDGLFLNAQKLSNQAILLSSINSPLYVCTLKSGSQFN